MTDELKLKATRPIDYFDDELRVDGTDGGKVFHVGKHYTKGVDYHEQRKDFWLDLAKREAMLGNSTGVIESALGWAEKHAKLAADCNAAAAMPSSVILTKAAADEIRTLVTTEIKTDFHRKTLKHMIEQAKTHAHLGGRGDVKRILSDAKEFAESVGLYNEDLVLEMKGIPSLVNAEMEIEYAIRGTSLSFEYAAAAARMGFVDVMENKLSYAEKDAALASIDIEEKVRKLIASLTPEQQKEFKKIADEKAKAAATGDGNKTVDNESTVTEDANNLTATDVNPEAKVVDNRTTAMVADDKNDANVAGDDRAEAADDTIAVKNTTTADDDGTENADDKPKVDDYNDTASVDNRTDSHGDHLIEETRPSHVEQITGADHKPEITKADNDERKVAGDKPKTEKDEMNGDVNKNTETKVTDSEEMVDVDDIQPIEHDAMIVAGDEQNTKWTDDAESGNTSDEATMGDGNKAGGDETELMRDDMAATSDKLESLTVAKHGDTTAITSDKTKAGKRVYDEIASSKCAGP